MGDPSALLDAEVPVLLSRADYDRTRRNFYLLSGMGRDDARLPKLVPPGALEVRLRDIQDPTFGDADRRAELDLPAYDTATPASAWVPARTRTVERTRQVCPPQILRHGQAPSGCRTEVYLEAAPAWDGRARLPRWVTLRDQSEALRNAQALAAQSRGNPTVAYAPRFDATPEAARAGLSDLVRVEVRDDDGSILTGEVEPSRPDATLTDDWWYDTAWGREEVVTFVPPLVLGKYGWQPAVVSPLDEGDDVVLVRRPHPYIVGMPEPVLGVVPLATQSGRGDAPLATSPADPRGRYRSPVVVTGAYKRNRPIRLPEGWIGWYQESDDSPWYERAVRDAVGTVARIGAVRLLAAGVGAIFTAGAAAPLIQAGLSLASSAGGDAAGGFVGAPGTAAATGTPPGASVTSGTAVSPSNALAELAERAAAEAPRAVDAAPVVAPTQTNVVLQEIAKGLAYIPFDSLETLAFRELVLQAEVRRARRDALRLELARIRAKVEAEGGVWLFAAQKAFELVRVVILTVASGGILTTVEAAIKAALEAAITALEMSLRLQNARALAEDTQARQRASIARRRAAEQTRIQGLIDTLTELEAEIAALQQQGLEVAAGGALEGPDPELNTPSGAFTLGQKLAGAVLILAGSVSLARAAGDDQR